MRNCDDLTVIGRRAVKFASSNLTAIIALSVCMVANNLKAQDMNELTKRGKAIVPIAAFEAKGDMECLSGAIEEGVAAGLTVNEIKEILCGLYAYTGFPRSLNALGVLMRLAESHKSEWPQDSDGIEPPIWQQEGKSSLEEGTATQTRLSGAPVKGGVMDFAPSIDYYLKAHLFGDVFGVKTVKETDRELATLSALSSLDGT